MNRPYGQELLGLITAARQGDHAAYGCIRDTWNDPLVGLMRRLTGWAREGAREVAALIWSKQRDRILRPPGGGGYTDGPMPPVNRPRLFHTYLLMDCTEWGRVLARHAEIALGFAEEVPEQIDLNTPSPRECLESRAACEALFSLACSPRTGYPHQQLTFMFARYVFGHGSNGSQGNVLRTEAKCGNVPLRDLVDRLKELLEWAREDECDRGSEWLERAFRRLHHRLDSTAGEMFGEGRDTQAMRQHASLLERVVGETCLRDYYPSYRSVGGEQRRRLTQNLLADWCRKVAVRIRAELGVPFLDAVMFNPPPEEGRVSPTTGVRPPLSAP